TTMQRTDRFLAGGVLLIASLLPSADFLRGQDDTLSQMYGSGVHAYFAGDTTESHEYLTRTIEAGTSDPRAYYFRGLANLQLGRPDEADADFTKGAELE